MSTVVRPVEHIAVPIILLGYLGVVFVLAGRLPAERRTAGYTGLWFGIVVSLIYVLVVDKLDPGLVTSLGARLTPQWLWATVVGFVVGLVVPGVYKLEPAPSWVRPALLALVSSVTSVGAVNLLAPPIEDLTVYGAPSALLGFLVLGLLPASLWPRLVRLWRRLTLSGAGGAG